MEALVRGFAERNASLITGLVDDTIAEIAGVVQSAATRGVRVEALAEEVRERLGVSESRAELIARDQTLKLNGEATEARHREAGITRYTWSTSKDERVRGNPDGLWPKGLHFDLDGTTQSWDDPPIVSEDGRREHPGGDFQCRCVALPNIAGLL
jgi:SPP1 gp7 family putative phage head morphogenesis protein